MDSAAGVAARPWVGKARVSATFAGPLPAAAKGVGSLDLACARSFGAAATLKKRADERAKNCSIPGAGVRIAGRAGTARRAHPPARPARRCRRTRDEARARPAGRLVHAAHLALAPRRRAAEEEPRQLRHAHHASHAALKRRRAQSSHTAIRRFIDASIEGHGVTIRPQVAKTDARKGCRGVSGARLIGHSAMRSSALPPFDASFHAGRATAVKRLRRVHDLVVDREPATPARVCFDAHRAPLDPIARRATYSAAHPASNARPLSSSSTR